MSASNPAEFPMDFLIGAPSAEHPALRVLAVAADEGSGNLSNLKRWAHELHIELQCAPNLAHAARYLSNEHWRAVFVELGERASEELEWWTDALRGAEGSPRLVALISKPTMGLVLQAEQSGVLDLLSSPPRREEFVRALLRIDANGDDDTVELAQEDSASSGPYALIGQSTAMLDVYKVIARVASSTATVLLQGQSGTGKEVAARAVHRLGSRASGPFVAVNCAAIPENLLESELFGHEKGSFTGAITRKIGRFELAVGGTLFLDEIADMSLALQAKILRAVQEREIERVGGDAVIPVDVRLIAATNRDLREAVAQGKFREDLYYRLAIVTIQLPRLQERNGDLLLLASHFVHEFARRYGKTLHRMSVRTLDLLSSHEWMGNVRELRNVMERAVIIATGDVLRTEHLPEELRARELSPPERPTSTLATLAEVEARHIARALEHTHGVIGAAAEILGIHRNTLARKMKEYGL